MKEPNSQNPYSSHRTLPVGTLEYKTEKQHQGFVDSVYAALEYGEKEVLFDLPKFVGHGLYCNLGDYVGGSAILMACGLKFRNLPGHVYTVDTYAYVPNQKEEADKNYAKHNAADRITQIVGKTYSPNTLKHFDGLKFQFVFVDADHAYNSVAADTDNYVKLLTEDGMIGYHDTNQDKVDRAIQDNLPKNFELKYWVNRIKIFGK